MKPVRFCTLLALLALFGCQSSRDLSSGEGGPVVNFDTLVVEAYPEPKPYRASETRLHDLLHTELHVRFNWDERQLLGQARLTVRPYFFEQDKLVLDARGFDIHRVALARKDSTGEVLQDLAHDYANHRLTITLDRAYQRQDTFTVFIDYTANPYRIITGGSAAITSDRGLYFINADGSEPDKPQQIWTQGETEANSAWFPTIDAPNERMTQTVYITVEDRFQTLSNGKLVVQVENQDGTRTDCWQQELPHAPYLTMMAIGEYAIVKDKWRDKEVHYYVEQEYAPHARKIFGNTPEMLSFYSRLLGVDYPWDKYHQVVVRDYVSGAMENTSAVIFGEFVQQTPREMLDGDHEDVVAHELFHHWFGDLVTCESWSNLPLNESFATYGEYLWIEHKYGREKADDHLHTDLRQYLAEARGKQEDLIRFDYDDSGEMFDRHSYAKGGRVLHMLRSYLGDEAFFGALQHYLTKHQYQAVEIHDLRLAFEAVTGQDLNWFFTQWFLASGHPELRVQYHYNDSTREQTVTISQEQDLNRTPLYRLPLEVDVYTNGKATHHQVVLEQRETTFRFPAARVPDLVNVDAKQSLLGVINDEKTAAQWAYQYAHAPLYMDRYLAIKNGSGDAESDSLCAEMMVNAMRDPNPRLRQMAVSRIKPDAFGHRDAIRNRLIFLAETDEEAAVRAGALAALQEHYQDPSLINVYLKAMKDESYAVLANGLRALTEVEPDAALAAAQPLETTHQPPVIYAIAGLYAQHGADEQNAFFKESFNHLSEYSSIGLIATYRKFLRSGKSDEVVREGLRVFDGIARESSAWWIRYYGIEAIQGFAAQYSEEAHTINQDLARLEGKENSSLEQEDLQTALVRVQAQQQFINELLAGIKAQESDEKLLKLLGD